MSTHDRSPEAIRARLAAIQLLTFDLDGTLTDATTWWAGEAAGWVQRYSVRDGEALLRMSRAGFPVVPLSRNKTDAARRRVEHMRCSTEWIGIDDKIAALAQICERHAVNPEHVLHVGDGLDDAPVFERVGLGVAVADAHPIALRTARLLLGVKGGTRVIEELEGLLIDAGHPVLARGLQ
jgi:3-deoxy-D-manno-octulosonate 8-phosphate phosphatase (KDO 8-P phosphatase)